MTLSVFKCSVCEVWLLCPRSISCVGSELTAKKFSKYAHPHAQAAVKPVFISAAQDCSEGVARWLGSRHHGMCSQRKAS